VEDPSLRQVLAQAAERAPPGRVAVLIDMGGRSGSELRPVVEGIAPQHPRVHARWEVKMTDDPERLWRGTSLATAARS
jgi:hypothetical protein